LKPTLLLFSVKSSLASLSLISAVFAMSNDSMLTG
jgi:hypothetical protein